MKRCTQSGNVAKGILRLALPAIAMFICTSPLAAQSAGYDLFQTGSGASVDLSSMGMGVVNLQGVPIQSSTGNADTIMYRSAAVPQGGGNVPVSVYALYMQSTSTVTYKGQPAEVFVTINNSGGAIPQSVLPQPDSLSASTGNLTVYPSSSTFDSNISVNADLIFVTPGGSPTNSSQILGSSAAPWVSMGTTGSTYTTTAPPGYPTPTCYPSGGFYPLPVHKGPHPVNRAKSSGGGGKNVQSEAATMNPALATCISNPNPSAQ